MKKLRHFIIPDVQSKQGVATNHLKAAGNYIVDKQPELVICLGDFADMPSLSSYDKGKKSFEGRRYKTDIDSAQNAMDELLTPLWRYNAKRVRQKMKQYRPKMIMLYGNHENRITRAIESEPMLDGAIGLHDLDYEGFGWETYPFLEAPIFDGIKYSHYFPRSANGRVMQQRRGAPNARMQVQREMCSCTAGHLQGLDWYPRPTGDRILFGLIAGSFYQHEEEYLSPQGTQYWRGCVMKNEVKDGYYDPMFLSLRYFLENWL